MNSNNFIGFLNSKMIWLLTMILLSALEHILPIRHGNKWYLTSLLLLLLLLLSLLLLLLSVYTLCYYIFSFVTIQMCVLGSLTSFNLYTIFVTWYARLSSHITHIGGGDGWGGGGYKTKPLLFMRDSLLTFLNGGCWKAYCHQNRIVAPEL